MYLHDDIYPGSRYELMAGGEPVEIVKVNANTFKFVSKSPNYIIPTLCLRLRLLAGMRDGAKAG